MVKASILRLTFCEFKFGLFLDTPCEARVDVAQFAEVLSTGGHRNLPVSSPHMNFCNGSTRLPFYFEPFPGKTIPWASWRQWPEHLELPRRYSSALWDYHIQNTLMFDSGKTAVNRWKTDQHLDLERPFRVSIVDGVGLPATRYPRFPPCQPRTSYFICITETRKLTVCLLFNR